MESLNDIFKSDIIKVNSNLLPEGFNRSESNISPAAAAALLSRVIDELGQLSTDAQGLSRVLTSARKLRAGADYAHPPSLYLMCDPAGNSGTGEAVGLLKVGRKHLFLSDGERTREADPLCVLDFYVRRDQQRRGRGKRLFDYMLQDQGAAPEQLAVDGPSTAMLHFLYKAYGLRDLQRQPNNFAIPPSFFQGPQADASPGLCTLRSAGAGRYTAARPDSDIARVIHGPPPPLASPSAPPAETPEPVLAPEPEPTDAEPAGAEPADVEPARRPSSLPVAVPVPAGLAPGSQEPSPAGSQKPSPAGSSLTRRDSQLTDKGFFDVKFYHNKLW